MEIYAAKNDSVFLTKRHYEDRCYNYNIINRDPFQRDRDRIIHSRAFRRIKKVRESDLLRWMPKIHTLLFFTKAPTAWWLS